jgi:chromosome condensin MukBEF ATPase and DNA-binding subunit MukB
MFGAINLIVIFPVIYYGARDIITAKVIEKEVKFRGTQKNPNDLYLIKTDKEIFQDSTKSFYIKDSSSRIYPNIERGKTYKFLIYGFGIPSLRIYRNILEIDEVK